MKNKTLFFNTIAFCLLFISGYAYALPFYYDSNEQGWQQAFVGRPAGSAFDTLYSNSSADWRATAGHPNGNIYQTARGVNQRAYWMGYSSSNFLGDLNGTRLQTDIFSSNNWQTLASGSGGDDGNVYARWVISHDMGDGSYNMFVSNQANSININMLAGWESHSIELDIDNFFRWPNAAAGTETLSQVLSHYSSIGLYIFSGTDSISNINGGAGTWNSGSQLVHYGAYSNDTNDAVWALDNFQAVAVAEPMSTLLFELGLVGLIARRRRITK